MKLQGHFLIALYTVFFINIRNAFMTVDKRMGMTEIDKRRIKKKTTKRFKTLDSPAGIASCFGYKGGTLKITIIKDMQGLRNQWQEATTKNPEGGLTKEDSSRKWIQERLREVLASAMSGM